MASSRISRSSSPASSSLRRKRENSSSISRVGAVAPAAIDSAGSASSGWRAISGKSAMARGLRSLRLLNGPYFNRKRRLPPAVRNHDKIPPVSPDLVNRVQQFLTSPAGASFEELALAAFAWQHERIEPFRRLCEGRGWSPRTVTDWRQVPPVPAAAFKTLTLSAAPDEPDAPAGV